MAEDMSAMPSSAGPSAQQGNSFLTDDQIDLILREAEQRLAAHEPASAPVRDQKVSLTTGTTHQEPGKLKDSTLSVRSIQKKGLSTEVSSLCSI